MMYKVVVSKIASFIRSIDLRKCNDRIVGKISNEGFHGQAFSYQKYQHSTLPKIIFILESPHVHEYADYPLPARKVTGSMIRSLFPQFILDNIECEYEVLLVNAIQYQCSLGVDTAAFRDDVFRSAWDDFGKSDFEKRLKYYFKDGDLIVNACTKGARKPYLREQVENSIFNALNKSSDYKISHPSSWGRKKGPTMWQVT
ncbi:hypothetical protein [Vibrio parahaemolyticus]|uniref:hypothetical protein n=1 Tax=Vibrio parahaemolyticus TaxID=670 RepID=UPI0023618A5C|nr:hypothetical protein [Vibrio parahaemolyticus]